MSKQEISYYFDPQLGAPLDARAAGTDATRPSIGLYTGLLRYNTEHNKFEYYDGSWTDLQLVPPIPTTPPYTTLDTATFPQPCLIYNGAANWAKFPLLMTGTTTEVRTLPAWTAAGKHLATKTGTPWLEWVDPPTFDYPQHWTTGANKLKILGGGFIGTSELENGPDGTTGDVDGVMATHTVRTREILPYANTNLNSNSNNANAHKTTLQLGSSTTPVTELHVGASPLSDVKEENNNFLVNAEVGDPVCNINANLTMGQITKRSGVTMGQITTGDPNHNLTLTTETHTDPAHTGHVQIGTGTATHINLEPKLVVNGHMRVDGTVEGTLATTDVTVSNTLTVDGDATFNGNVNIGGNSRVYFSVQLGNGAQSHGTSNAGYRHQNYLNEIQSSVPADTRGLAGYSDTWDISGMLSSGGNDQADFATNGYVVPRDGVYKIDCYQTIRSMINNSGVAGLRVYRNPTASIWTAQHYQDSTCLAATEEAEHNGWYPLRSESVVWLGQLNQGDAIKFMITCDNGFGPQVGIWKGCYTIISVD